MLIPYQYFEKWHNYISLPISDRVNTNKKLKSWFSFSSWIHSGRPIKRNKANPKETQKEEK
jgi:hypothetical protein